MTLKIAERLVDDVTVLDLDGRITLGEGSVILRNTIKKLLHEGKKKILMNMAAVRYIDSSGNGALVAAYTNVRAAGGMLRLLKVVGKPLETLQVSKLFTVFDVFDAEDHAIGSFKGSMRHCVCPVCGYLAGPSTAESEFWPPQVCGKCNSQFTVISLQSTKDEVLVKTVRIQTYKDEYFEILSGKPLSVQVLGRLDLFSSSALERVWHTLPAPRRVLFKLHRATEINDAGRAALLSLLTSREEDAQAVVSLEGLSCEQVTAFPDRSPFYSKTAAALAALGHVSDTHPWTVKILKW